MNTFAFMRENKSIDDYTRRIHEQILEKYNIDIPVVRIRGVLTFFFLRIKESMLTHRFIYINRFFYLYFSHRRLIQKLVRRKELLSPDELYKQNGTSYERYQPYYKKNWKSFLPKP